MTGGEDHHVNICMRGGGDLLFTWPEGGSLRNFDLSNKLFMTLPKKGET